MNSKPTLYHENFEIIFRNKNNCQEMSGCRIRYDFDGKQIGETKLYELKNSWNVLTLPVNDQSPDEGHHTLGFNFTNNNGEKYSTLFWTVVYVNPSGQEIQQMIVQTKHYPTYRTAHSNSHKRYGVCRIEGVNDTMNEVYCTQFNVTGKYKKDPYNLQIRDNECKGFRMQRITSDGRTLKELKIKNFQSKGTRFGFED
ncbi:uncharacterized protein LOC116416907 [Nasonia vitripennis]|uniref:Uncharacterized protein n=1 Tax=Nasonia vitripennis TaxID=7425 RepID=A0A7M7Q9V0_NASVI|nr:uncharacterized protein LOC116416907 [Nasonia vitripennis]